MINIRLILLFSLLCAVTAAAVEYTLPAELAYDWEAGVTNGVTGGSDQYGAGGAIDRAVSGTVYDVTDPAYGAVADGVTDDKPAIAAAIAAAGAGDVVYLPAGTYAVNSAISLSSSKDEITLRGDGPGLTTILYTGVNTAGLVYVGSGTDYNASVTYSRHEYVASLTKTKDTVTFTVADGTDYNSGNMMLVSINNQMEDAGIQAGTKVPTLSTSGAERVRTYITRVASRDGNDITLVDGLPTDCYDLPIRFALQQSFPSNKTWRVGIEDMTINSNEKTQGTLTFSYTDECWANNVELKRAINYPINGSFNYRPEIIHSIIGPGKLLGSNGAGVLWNNNHRGLIADNIILAVDPLIEENQGSSRNIWAYNALVEAPTTSILYHGAHPMGNLYEGNISRNIKSDGYFGSSSHNVYLRNLFHGNPNDGASAGTSWTTSMNRFTRKYALVGNIFGWDGISSASLSYGNPNIGSSGFTGYAGPTGNSSEPQAEVGDFWADWKMTGVLTTRLSDKSGIVTMDFSTGQLQVNQGAANPLGNGNGPYLRWGGSGALGASVTLLQVDSIDGLAVTFGQSPWTGGTMPDEGTAVEVWTFTNGFQERDLDVEPSFYLVHNYESLEGGTGAITNDLGADTLPDSFGWTAEPAWWGDNGFAGSWPPIDPDSPTPSMDMIPAGARYLAIIGTVSSPTFSPVAGTYGSPQNIAISTATPSSTIYYTTDGSPPDDTDTVYSTPINVIAPGFTIKAFAEAAGLTDSGVSSATYVIGTRAAAPTFSPVAGTYGSTQNVTISSITVGSVVYYTTDGSDPTVASAVYSTPVAVSASGTLKAIATAPSYLQSTIATADYVIGSTAVPPVFSPVGGAYTEIQNVTMTSSTPGAVIYYTTDGSTPTASSSLYSSPVPITVTGTLKAYVVASGYTDSSVTTANYTITLPPVGVTGINATANTLEIGTQDVGP